MPAPRVMKDSGDYIEYSDYLKLLESCKDDMEKLMLTILWKTGRRVSEILGGKLKRNDGIIECEGLKPKDIDYENKIIHFWIIKKKEIYKSPKPIDDELLMILKDYITRMSIPNDARVIPRTRQWWDLIVKRMTRDTGVTTFSGRRLHAHCFRHSWNKEAGSIAETPEDIALQKAYMEHSNENITMSYYMKFGSKAQRKLIERMAKKNEN